MVKETAPKEKTVITEFQYSDGKPNCNPATTICVRWEQPDQADIQSKGKGTAFRNTEGEHYAEVKTTGYSSNTSLTITHNDSTATALLGDGSPGGNTVTIKQATGVARR